MHMYELVFGAYLNTHCNGSGRVYGIMSCAFYYVNC